jgi:hypothetical protein
MEAMKMSYANGLPEYCYSTNDVTNEVILIKRGETGYHRYLDGAIKGKSAALTLNIELGVTIVQAESMKMGSMFGWHVPGANPNWYDENGRF